MQMETGIKTSSNPRKNYKEGLEANIIVVIPKYHAAKLVPGNPRKTGNKTERAKWASRVELPS